MLKQKKIKQGPGPLVILSQIFATEAIDSTLNLTLPIPIDKVVEVHTCFETVSMVKANWLLFVT